MSVSFVFNTVKRPKIFNQQQLKSWLKSIQQHYGVTVRNIQYVFVNDETLWQINTEFLNHDTYTDIITFNLADNNTVIEAEIYISLERIEENSTHFATSFLDELLRVMAHGVLHLIGYKDKSKKQQAIMREQENYCIHLYYLQMRDA